MTIIEKLGITKGPWSLSGSYDQLIVYNKGEHIKDVLFESWDSHKKKGCTPDTIVVSASPEMLEALIIGVLTYEENFYDADECFYIQHQISVIEKAAGKTWEQIKQLISEE